MFSIIKQKLQDIETEHKIKILYAVESGAGYVFSCFCKTSRVRPRKIFGHENDNFIFDGLMTYPAEYFKK